MKKFKILFLTISFSLLLYGCPSNDDDGHQFITIANNSDSEIRVQMVHSSKITLKDTLWVCELPDIPIEPNSERMFEPGNAIRGYSWEDNFKYIPFIQFLIFDAEVYDSLIDYDIPCNKVNYTIPVKHYYQLKLEDLERMNWQLVYYGN